MGVPVGKPVRGVADEDELERPDEDEREGVDVGDGAREEAQVGVGEDAAEEGADDDDGEDGDDPGAAADEGRVGVGSEEPRVALLVEHLAYFESDSSHGDLFLSVVQETREA